jgi:CheY-like chemotaxis protein
MRRSRGEQPTILLIEEDDDTRLILKESLIRYGYLVLLALDEEDAISRVDGGQVKGRFGLNKSGRQISRRYSANGKAHPRTCEV